jgi:LmbE family N-acetylglucosaminyl deacetylase
MLELQLGRARGSAYRVLVVGAHADDIEIGCGGTILHLIGQGLPLQVTWVVLGARGEREREAHDSAAAFLKDAEQAEVVVESFRDGFFPWTGAEVKELFETLKPAEPDLVLVHRRDDAHQDHRLVAELAWNTFRDHLILEYEIPKYDGDLGQPNLFVPLPKATCERKVELLLEGFPSQRARRWFTPDTFWSMLRLRGIEAASPSGFAEGFHCRKAVVGPITPDGPPRPHARRRGRGGQQGP